MGAKLLALGQYEVSRGDQICDGGGWRTDETRFVIAPVVSRAHKNPGSDSGLDCSCDIGFVANHCSRVRRAPMLASADLKNSGEGLPRTRASQTIANSGAATNGPATRLNWPSSSLNDRFLARGISSAPSTRERKAVFKPQQSKPVPASPTTTALRVPFGGPENSSAIAG
jgi:outer membrane scaffolding protein for murein synthesis (MipA/OmpV family)